jgi:hypothetical protein
MTITEHQVLEWLATGETGCSSLTMAHWLTFKRVYKHSSHPYDPADLRRCVQLLDRAPTLRCIISRMGDLSPEWAAMVRRWTELEQLLREELPTGRAPKTYALMKELLGRPS